MSLKYAPKDKVALFTLLAAIKACNVLFVAYMLKVMLNIASSGKSDYGRLVMFAALTAGGQLFFMASNFIYETTKMNIIKDVNMTLKKANLRYLVDQNTLDIKDGLSFIDRKSVV